MNTSNMIHDDIEELEFMDRAAMAVLPAIMGIIGALNEGTIDGRDRAWFHSHSLNVGHLCYSAAAQMSEARRNMRAKKQRMADERVEERRRAILEKWPAQMTPDGKKPCTET